MPALSGKKQGRQANTEVILDSIADGVFTVDLEWNITSLNRAGERLLNITRREAIGQKCFDVFCADLCQKACPLKKSIKTGKEIINVKANILNCKGRKVIVSISTAVLKNEKGKIIGGAETFRDLSAIEVLQKEIRNHYTFEDIISRSHEVRKIFDILPDIAESESTVLIEGPSGSGKELFAKAIHNLNPRRNGRFVAVNCGAIPDTLLESELFGYVKGAFTNANRDKPGRFALAERGTIFLDEIGEISRAIQVKLLRVLQEKEYEPLGSTQVIKANVRIISATNNNLAELVAQGKFRDDLYYRLNIIKIVLPPLVQRREDVPILIEHFINKFNIKKGKKVEGLSEKALMVLMTYDFPGNVRELENIIEHAFILCHGSQIDLKHLPAEIQQWAVQKDKKRNRPTKNNFSDAETAIIVKALKNNQGNRRATAAELGMEKTTLWRKMRKHGIHYPF